MCEISNSALQKLIRENQVQLSLSQKLYLKVKQFLDLICALLASIALSPLLLFVAIAIKIDSPHESVLFKQERVGQYGKTFLLYKFRSMKQGTPELGTHEFMDAEQYITRIGKFIRKTSIDELPQLWCCITGTMSLIGYRPLLKREAEIDSLRNYYGIYQLKPGITGFAQINGRDILGDYDKVRWDRTYVHNVSLVLDAKILWRTVMKVLKREDIVDESALKRATVSKEALKRTDELYDDEVKIIAK